MATVQSDNGPLELPVELVPFCESSRSFYIAARALSLAAENQTGTAQQLLAALAALAPLAVETAPSAEFAAQPMAAVDQLAIIIPALAGIEYDANRFDELPDAQGVLEALEDFTVTRASLQTFLIEACGADTDVLDNQAQGAVAVAAEAAGETIEPEAVVEAVDGSPITNASSTITVSVPPDWTETAEATDDPYSRLAASSDIDGFLALTTPGVLVLRGEGGFRDGGFVGRVLSFEADLEEAGCTLVDQRNYADVIYTGQERIFDCGVEGIDVRILGGTTDDEQLYAMVLLVYPTDEPGIRQLVVDTFEVS